MVGPLFMFPGSACCRLVGFDQKAAGTIKTWFDGDRFAPIEVVEDLAEDLSRLHECRVVFAGHDPNALTCGSAIHFAKDDWPRIRDYIRCGGRVWLSLEYEGCLTDPDQAEEFLQALGTSITWSGDLFDCGCEGADDANEETRECRPGEAKIAQAVSVKMACSARIDGGTVVWYAPVGRRYNGEPGEVEGEPVPIVAVERIGEGFLFVAGDVNFLTGCGYDNARFFCRVLHDSDDQII